MFASVLIANRGEIACRIARTAARLGLRTIAVYSQADAKALHVRQCDEAYPIGPSPSRESYLVIEKIIGVARYADCDAVHPGYGFLAENPALARACLAAGITFILPAAWTRRRRSIAPPCRTSSSSSTARRTSSSTSAACRRSSIGGDAPTCSTMPAQDRPIPRGPTSQTLRQLFRRRESLRPLIRLSHSSSERPHSCL